MKIVKASATIIQYTPDLENIIERAGRVCYKSEDRMTRESAAKFIAHLDSLQHESVLEHGAITVHFVCDRGVSHELVRHRIASFSQESTRYCNYSKDKFGQEITVIEPIFFNEDFQRLRWKEACQAAEIAYFELIESGAKPQEARSVLPNSLKTEVIMTANPREWRHVFKLRCSHAAHPQMRELMVPLFVEFNRRWPNVFPIPSPTNNAGESK
jgi:thymidylate synthase (FAD)